MKELVNSVSEIDCMILRILGKNNNETETLAFDYEISPIDYTDCEEVETDTIFFQQWMLY